jgi:hypothetical protein
MAPPGPDLHRAKAHKGRILAFHDGPQDVPDGKGRAEKIEKINDFRRLWGLLQSFESPSIASSE